MNSGIGVVGVSLLAMVDSGSGAAISVDGSAVGVSEAPVLLLQAATFKRVAISKPTIPYLAMISPLSHSSFAIRAENAAKAEAAKAPKICRMNDRASENDRAQRNLNLMRFL